MGFQDREYYRESSSQSIYVTSMVIKLIIINAIVFLAEILFFKDLAGNSLVSFFGAHANTIVRPLYWWQLITAGFVHDPLNISHVFFNMLGIYFLGIPLEDRLGRRAFLRF